MKTWHTPKGAAGSDQVYAMEESAHAEIEKMFSQAAKRNVLDYGIERTVNRPDSADISLRQSAQRRECDSGIVFHAARALEITLNVLLARATNRIPGREHPDMSEDQKDQIHKERRTHGLKPLHERIVGLNGSPSGQHLKCAMEDIYQQTLHEGITDVFVDGERLGQFVLEVARIPFFRKMMGGLRDGSEITTDHVKNYSDVIFALEREPIIPGTFENFLEEADRAYYESDLTGKGRNLSWARYGARDHEPGRGYVTVGIIFFSLLTQRIMDLSHWQQWTWQVDFARRWHERRQYQIQTKFEAQLRQGFVSQVELPPMKSIEETMQMAVGRGYSSPGNQSYERHHKWIKLMTGTSEKPDKE